MTVSKPSSKLGHFVFGVVALAFGLIALIWHGYNDWHPRRYLIYAAAAALIFGGAAIPFRRSAKTGAVVLAAVYFVFALQCVSGIIAKPQIYDGWATSSNSALS
jgi:hypothetical protein